MEVVRIAQVRARLFDDLRDDHVLHHLFDQRVIGDLNIAVDVFTAGGHLGKNGSQQVVALDPLNVRRNLLAVAKAEQRKRAVGVPAEAGGEQRRTGEHGLLQDLLDRLRLKEVEDVGERKAVLLGKRDVDAVIGGRGLQLKVEAAAETLAQGQAPSAVDARAKGRVDDKLHAAALVKEALGDDAALRRHRSENGAALGDVFRNLLQRVGVETYLADICTSRCSALGSRGQPCLVTGELGAVCES